MADLDLSLKQHISFQEKHWRLAHYLWIPAGLFLLAALLGLFGGAGLWQSQAVKSSGGTLNVQYPRYARLKAPAQFTVQMGPVSSSSVRLAIDNQYLEALDIQHITPAPDSVQAAGPRTIYTFNTQPGVKPLEVIFAIKFQNMGSVSGKLQRLDNSQSVMLNQFIYP